MQLTWAINYENFHTSQLKSVSNNNRVVTLTSQDLIEFTTDRYAWYVYSWSDTGNLSAIEFVKHNSHVGKEDESHRYCSLEYTIFMTGPHSIPLSLS